MGDLRPESLALVQGRFGECERLLGDRPATDPGAALVLVALRREQGWPAEAEGLVRSLLADRPDLASARALRAAVLGDLGRDGEAWREMRRLSMGGYSAVGGDLASLVLLAELCTVLDDTRQAQALRPLLAPHAPEWAVDPDGTACVGSVHRGLGLISHALGDWDDAVAEFEHALDEHVAAGAPVLVAHTRRELAATLRSRGADGDWERGLDLLSGAATIYQQLGVERLADQARSVLRRSDTALADHRSEAGVFRRDSEGWTIGSDDHLSRLPHSRGLADIAVLLSQPGRGVHVWELAASDGGEAAAEYVDRLREVEHDLARAEASGDRVGASLARVEREFVVGRLAAPVVDDGLDRVRAAVVARIRAGIDRVEKADADLGRHLRHCVSTGTFCTYDPDRPRRWAL